MPRQCARRACQGVVARGDYRGGPAVRPALGGVQAVRGRRGAAGPDGNPFRGEAGGDPCAAGRPLGRTGAVRVPAGMDRRRMWQGRPYIRYGPGADRALGPGSPSSAMGTVGRVSGHPGGLRARRGAWHDDRRPCAVRGAGVGSRSQGGLSRPAGEPRRRCPAARLRVGGRPVEHDQRALRHFFFSGGHRLPRAGGVPHGFLPQRSGH